MDEDVAFLNKTAMFNETLRQQGLADLVDALQGGEEFSSEITVVNIHDNTVKSHDTF